MLYFLDIWRFFKILELVIVGCSNEWLIIFVICLRVMVMVLDVIIVLVFGFWYLFVWSDCGICLVMVVFFVIYEFYVVFL